MTQQARPLQTGNTYQVNQASDHDHKHDHGGHNHSHAGHNHGLPANLNGRIGLIFRLALIFTLLFVVGEFVAGLLSNSLALISDAGHNLTDALALAFSWWALVLARRSPNYNKTYGYHRAGILAASLNAGTLLVIALYIFYEGVHRLLQPEPVQGPVVAIVAGIALVLNTVIALALANASKEDLNVRSAFVHILGDALSSVGVIAAGLATWLTGLAIFDPLVSLLIGVFIIWSSWGIIKEATNVLLEGIPAGLDMVALMHDLMAVERVKSVHDLHVWTIGGNFRALSCHVLTDNTSLQEANTTVHEIKHMLDEQYNIHHATLELECESCNLPQEVYCTAVQPQSLSHKS